jgi:tetratricopeptide (TPR) repeat protein
LGELATGWTVERSATWRNCGHAYQQINNLVEAEQWYKRSVDEAPEELDAWFAYAQFMYTQSRWEECLNASSKVLTLKPQSHYLADDSMTWRMYDLLGIASWNLGNKGSAKKYARIAMELNPDEERLKNNYAFMISTVVKEFKDGLQDGLSDPGL